jgi:PPK2 family polyphosphate:nucleotide phosphotransferase
MKDYLVKPGKKISLKDVDPNDVGDWAGRKDEAKSKLVEVRQRLDALQDVMYAEHKQKLLIVIQAMDTAGKDGTIRAVFEGVNPQGVRVANFKVPTPIEMDHDYLWRVHPQVPGKGEIVVFNRSQYEEVLVVRVHKLVPEATWKRHYQQINDFERMLSEEGVTLLKIFLHIDLEEQKQRLLERIDTPEKRWKFNPGDLGERKLWNDYMGAYEDMLNQTSTDWAPWHTIPANHNWYRNLIVANLLVETMEGFKMTYPNAVENIEQYRKALEDEE